MTQKTKLIAFVDPGSERRREGAGAEEGSRTDAPSDGQRHEAVVLLDVAFEYVRARPQDTLETGPVQLDALQGPPGDHGGSAGTVHQQSDLTWKAQRKNLTEIKT